MKTLKQLLRQPLKTLMGIFLLALAAAILCVTVGQYWAAKSTKAELDREFSTVAIPAEQEELTGSTKFYVDQELLDFLNKMAAEHPDIVKGVYQHGVLSASIPELSPYSEGAGTKIPQYISGGMPDEVKLLFVSAGASALPHYDCAMLVFTLEEMTVTKETFSHMHNGLPRPETAFPSKEEYEAYINANQWTTVEHGYTAQLTGTVTDVISLQEGWEDPTGRTFRFTVTVPSKEKLDALELEVGAQYIAYGMDYYDDYKYLVAYMAGSSYKHVDFYPFDPELYREPTQQEKENYKNNQNIDVAMIYDDVPLRQWQADSMNAVSMSAAVDGGLIQHDVIRDEGYILQEVKPVTEVTYTNAKGESVTVDWDEYYKKYAIPTIQKLTGSVEDFLASPEGEPWQAAIERDEINNHGFAVFGVEEMDHLAAFALGKDKIGEGREFTPEEVETGARVCIVHELIAHNAGLKVGDTVTLSFYGTDYALPYQRLFWDGLDLLRPAATLYFDTTPILETAEYTIVGLWQGELWPYTGDNPYSFSANTVFVPQSSVQVPMEKRNNFMSNVGVLENGMIPQFHELAKRSGFAGAFKYSDQNFSKIATNFHNYDSLGRQMLMAGAVIYVMLLVLFLLLFPAAMKKPVKTMQSLGVSYSKRFFHVLLSSMALVVPASVMGGVVGERIWHYMVDFLQELAESSIALQLDPQALGSVCLAQMGFALALSFFVALSVAAPRGLSSRR